MIDSCGTVHFMLTIEHMAMFVVLSIVAQIHGQDSGSIEWCINKLLELTSDAQTKVGKHVTAIITCAHSQRYTKDSVFWFAQTTLCVTTLRNLPPFDNPKYHFRWSKKWNVNKSIATFLLMCAGGGSINSYLFVWGVWGGEQEVSQQIHELRGLAPVQRQIRPQCPQKLQQATLLLRARIPGEEHWKNIQLYHIYIQQKPGSSGPKFLVGTHLIWHYTIFTPNKSPAPPG